VADPNDITLAYLYPDGTVLDPAGHNNNVHSKDTTVRSGLMSTANGFLTTDNLVSGFTVRKHHVMHEETAIARMESMIPTSTTYADGVAEEDARDNSDDQWFTLPGCSLRWYQPYDASVAVANWSFFTSHNRWKGLFTDRDGDGHTATPGLRLRCVVDGTVIAVSRRQMTRNHVHPVSPGSSISPGRDLFTGKDGGSEPGGNPGFVDSEAHSALHWDQHYVDTSSLPLKGYHEISVQARMTLDVADTVKTKAAGSTTYGDKFQVVGFFKLFNHISLGIRNARVLTLL
jgi:hypothetical protein